MGRLALLAVMGVIAAVIAIYVGLRHPLWLFWALAFTTGALPFGQFPGVNLPFYLPLAFGVVLAVYLHPPRMRAECIRSRSRPGR